MASTTLAATVADDTVPTGFMPVLIMPGMTTLTPTGALSDADLGAQDVGEPEHPVLGHGVGPEATQRHDGRHGAGVDDVAFLFRGQNARHEGADAVDDAPQVDVDDPVPLLERDLPGVAAVDDAGVVHGHVELSEPLDRPRRRLARPLRDRARRPRRPGPRHPRRRASSRASRRFSSSMSAMTTCMPSAANASTTASPMPLAAPVTTAVRPCELVHGRDGTWRVTGVPRRAPSRRRPSAKMVAGWSGVTDSADEILGTTGHASAHGPLPGRKVDSDEGELLTVPLPAHLRVAGPGRARRSWRRSTTSSASGRTGSSTTGSTTSSWAPARHSFWPAPPSSRWPGRPGWPSGSPCSLWFLGSAAWDVAYAGQSPSAVPVVRGRALAGLVPADRRSGSST